MSGYLAYLFKWGLNLNFAFPPLNMGLIEISRSRFKLGLVNKAKQLLLNLN